MGESHREIPGDLRATELQTICLIGLGYVGLPAATMFALNGLTVIGVDINPMVVNAVNDGHCPIVEPGLPEAVSAARRSGCLTASERPLAADAFIVAVPTPFHADTHMPDLSFVNAAALSIVPVLKAGDLVVLESTSPVGTTRHVMNTISRLRPDLAIDHDAKMSTVDFAYSPERVMPGMTMQEIVSNDRVIGGVSRRAAHRAAALYKTFVKGRCVLTDDRTAEMVKLTENAYRDVNIAFANELSLICAECELDTWEVIQVANCHPRVSILSPGPGVGGHCISVDPWFIVSASPNTARLIRTAREVNDSKPLYIIDLVRSAVGRIGSHARIACFGISYKPDTDDRRESPALSIAERLATEFPGQVIVVDPYVHASSSLHSDEQTFAVTSAEEALAQCDIVVLLVGHRQFAELGKPTGCEVIDTIGLWR